MQEYLPTIERHVKTYVPGNETEKNIRCVLSIEIVRMKRKRRVVSVIVQEKNVFKKQIDAKRRLVITQRRRHRRQKTRLEKKKISDKMVTKAAIEVAANPLSLLANVSGRMLQPVRDLKRPSILLRKKQL